MMWGVLLNFVSVLALAASDEIKVECNENYGFPPESSQCPSVVSDLKLQLVTVGTSNMINVTWAINIDGSIGFLQSTRIETAGEPTYHCEYNPPLSKTNLTGTQQKWFHHMINVSYGLIVVHVANLPLAPQGSGLQYKVSTIDFPFRVYSTKAPVVTTVEVTAESNTPALTVQDITIISFGGLAGLMILSSCYIMNKIFRRNVATSLGFPNLYAGSVVQVPVLVVYPAEDSAFQQAVVALAEFLQWHGGCNVALDMWQQGRIAELGPMRWLAEQTKSAERVLIVNSQVKTPLQCPNHNLSKPSIPAAAHDLYPLILNMVASHAKSASELSKFWVVQLCVQQDKKPSVLEPELRACKSFRLMKDFKKLWKNLHAHRKSGKKTVDLIFKPSFPCDGESTVKLKEAVERLRRHQPNISTEKSPLNSVVVDV